MLRNFVLIGICIILIFTGCSVERNLARQYMKNHVGTGIMIVPLYEMYKDNLTISYDTSITYSSYQYDSIAWAQACYVPYVSDSIFLTQFTNNLIEELGRYKYDVYLDGSADLFLSLPDPKWIIQIAHLELKEDHRMDYYEMYSMEEDEPHYEKYRINQVNLSSWFDVSRANAGNKQVLFLEAYIQDDFNLGVDVDLMKVSFGYIGSRDSLEVKDIYKMAQNLGTKHAELLFDYFLNDYIREHLPPGIINRQSFHYNTATKSLKKGLPERFDVVK